MRKNWLDMCFRSATLIEIESISWIEDIRRKYGFKKEEGTQPPSHKGRTASAIDSTPNRSVGNRSDTWKPPKKMN